MYWQITILIILIFYLKWLINNQDSKKERKNLIDNLNKWESSHKVNYVKRKKKTTD